MLSFIPLFSPAISSAPCFLSGLVSSLEWASHLSGIVNFILKYLFEYAAPSITPGSTFSGFGSIQPAIRPTSSKRAKAQWFLGFISVSYRRKERKSMGSCGGEATLRRRFQHCLRFRLGRRPNLTGLTEGASGHHRKGK